MKYLTYGLLYQANPKTLENEENYSKTIREALEKRNVGFEKAKGSMSNKSLSIYTKNSCFHDYTITEISVRKNVRSNATPLTEIVIKLEGKSHIELRYTSVMHFELISKCEDKHALVVSRWEGQIDDYMYDEFDTLENNFYAHDILLLQEALLQFITKD